MIGSGMSRRRWLNCNVFMSATEKTAPREEKRTSERLRKKRMKIRNIKERAGN